MVGEGDGREEFRFEPYRLMFNQRAWYVIGHHGGRDALRNLKLSRFVECSVTAALCGARDFSLDDHLGQAWRMIRGDTRYDVVIDFDAEFAETISDTHWHATQDIEHHDDGSITFRCSVDGLDEIVWWVLSMGPHAVVGSRRSCGSESLLKRRRRLPFTRRKRSKRWTHPNPSALTRHRSMHNA